MSPAENDNAALRAIDLEIQTQLAPIVGTVDTEGFYPEAVLRELGRLGGFGSDKTIDDLPGVDLARQTGIITRVGRICGSTAFLVWCQSTCAWYLQHAPEAAVRERFLAPVLRGDLLAGTGMSNAVKHLDGIEKIRLTAEPCEGGYVVNGILPWVSNVGPGHLVIVAAAVADGGHLMFAAHAGTAGLDLHPCPEFAGLQGTRTVSLHFKGLIVEAADVLAHPVQFDGYLERIKAGFILNQVGIGFGVIEGSLKTIREARSSHSHVNLYLDDQEDGLHAALQSLQQQAQVLTHQAQAGYAQILPVLKLRAAVSELTLRAANAAVLHAGARGYLMRHPPQRRLREAVFVAIVTPALKHLRKAIDELEQFQRSAAVA